MEKLVPESIRSIREFITYVEVKMAHALHDVMYERAYGMIDAVLPHKYWMPLLFLGFCCVVHHANFKRDFSFENLVLAVDAETMSLARFRQLEAVYVQRAAIEAGPATPTPSLASRVSDLALAKRLLGLAAPVLDKPLVQRALATLGSVWAVARRYLSVMGLLFGGVVFQHVLMTLGYVFMTESTFQTTADKFLYLSGNGMNTESIFAFFVGDVVAGKYDDVFNQVSADLGPQGSGFLFLVRPFCFTFFFFVLRRVCRNLSGALFPSLDSIPLLIAVLLVVTPYAFEGTHFADIYSQSFLTPIKSGAVVTVAFVYENFYKMLLLFAGVLLYINVFVVSSPMSVLKTLLSVRPTNIVSLIRSSFTYHFLSYFVHWSAFQLRFDWWFGAGLGLSLMDHNVFSPMLSRTILPVLAAFMELFWFPFFDTAREMCFALPPPEWTFRSSRIAKVTKEVVHLPLN